MSNKRPQRFADRFLPAPPTEEPIMSPEDWQAKIQADLGAFFVEKQIVPLFAVEAAVREAFNPDNEDTPILASNAEIDAVVNAVVSRLKQQIGGHPS